MWTFSGPFQYFFCIQVLLLLSLKARSHDPILGSENWTQVFRQFNFNVEMTVMQHAVICCQSHPQSSILQKKDDKDIIENLSPPFIFQEECRMKREHVLCLSAFSKLRISVSEGHFYCIHPIRLSELTKFGSLKSNCVNGP